HSVGANPAVGTTTRVAQCRGTKLKPSKAPVQTRPRAPFWNVNRTSEPGLGANECVLHMEDVVQAHGIPPCARSSKRAGGLIPRIALDQCRVPERYRTRVPIFVPIAQSTERARPKRQVAGERPAGDSISRVWFNSRMRPCQGRDDGAIPFTRSIWIGSVAHQQRCLRTATFDMREAERTALW